jgi:hypothetical protein
MIAGETNRITQVTRRDIVDLLLLRSEPFHGRLGLVDFLRRVWNLSSLPSADSRFENAEGDIWQHMVSFRDWDYSYLLYDYLDILRSPDELFGKFLETCLHPLVVPDPYQAVPLCQDINARLRADGFELKPGPPISGRPVFKLQTVESQSPTEGEGGSHYEVVLSFAGEEREYVEEVAQILAASGVLVFYDKFERATLWGKDLSEHLHTVYAGSARYCVMFISKAYAEKIWPTHERRSAFEKAIMERQEHILPARFDDTEIPGLRKSICYVDLRGETPGSLARLILEKLGRK